MARTPLRAANGSSGGGGTPRSAGSGGTVRTSTPRLVMACLPAPLPRMMYIMYFYLPSKTNGAVAAKKDLQKDAEVTFCFVFGIFLLMLDCRSI